MQGRSLYIKNNFLNLSGLCLGRFFKVTALCHKGWSDSLRQLCTFWKCMCFLILPIKSSYLCQTSQKRESVCEKTKRTQFRMREGLLREAQGLHKIVPSTNLCFLSLFQVLSVSSTLFFLWTLPPLSVFPVSPHCLREFNAWCSLDCFHHVYCIHAWSPQKHKRFWFCSRFGIQIRREFTGQHD